MLACGNRFYAAKLSTEVLPLIAALLVLVPLSVLSETVENPRLALIMSRTTFDRTWDVAQMSGQGWVGIANLAGIPYDTLFLEDLVADEHPLSYRVLVFAECTSIEPNTVSRLTAILTTYLNQGGNVLIDGPLGAFAQNGKAQSPSDLWSLLGISGSGVKGDTNFRIQVSDNHHFITRPFEPSQYLSQPLAKGLEVQGFSSGGHVLVTSTNGRESFPFLSYRDTGANRLVLISDATTFAGATSIFRNEPPQGFFANEVVNVLLRNVNQGEGILEFVLDRGSSRQRQLEFSSSRPVKQLQFNGQSFKRNYQEPNTRFPCRTTSRRRPWRFIGRVKQLSRTRFPAYSGSRP